MHVSFTYLENDAAAPLCLIGRQLEPMPALLVGALPKELGKAVQRLIVAAIEAGHGQVDVAGIELHVDLLVEHGLHHLAVVHADPRATRHL